MRGDNEHIEGMVRGALGSLAGLAAMGLFFRAMKAFSGGDGDSGAARKGEGDFFEWQDGLDDVSLVGSRSEADEPATASVGRIGYRTVMGGEPDAETKKKLGQAVHWGYGVLMGSVYGALRPEARTPDLAAGLGYGTALWVLGDEIMVPLLGLAEGPTAHSMPEQAKALGAHLAYGAATATVTQALRRVM